MSARQSYYVGVKGIITHPEDGAILVLKDGDRGRWELPGGRVDQGQKLDEAFAREIEEEVEGAKMIKFGDLHYAAQGDFVVENDHKLLLLFYNVEVKLPGLLKVSDEHHDAAWVTKETLKDFDFYSTDYGAITRVFERQSKAVAVELD